MMQDIATEAQIKKRIQELEQKQARELEDLKSQLRVTYTNMQPVNLIKNTIHDIMKAPEVQDDLLNTGVSLAAGYLAKKVAFGNSDSVVKNVLGDLFQVGITATIAKHPEEVKAIAHKVIEFVTASMHTKPVAEEGMLRKRLMKQIMQITQLIQTSHPQLYKILEETPLPVADSNSEISVDNLRSYRDSLKLQLLQFGDK